MRVPAGRLGDSQCSVLGDPRQSRRHGLRRISIHGPLCVHVAVLHPSFPPVANDGAGGPCRFWKRGHIPVSTPRSWGSSALHWPRICRFWRGYRLPANWTTSFHQTSTYRHRRRHLICLRPTARRLLPSPSRWPRHPQRPPAARRTTSWMRIPPTLCPGCRTCLLLLLAHRATLIRPRTPMRGTGRWRQGRKTLERCSSTPCCCLFRRTSPAHLRVARWEPHSLIPRRTRRHSVIPIRVLVNKWEHRPDDAVTGTPDDTFAEHISSSMREAMRVLLSPLHSARRTIRRFSITLCLTPLNGLGKPQRVRPNEPY